MTQPLDREGRPLRVGQQVTILDFRNDREGERRVGWDNGMIPYIGRRMLIREISDNDNHPDGWDVRLEGNTYHWLGRWFKLNSGLRELVVRYREDAGP